MEAEEIAFVQEMRKDEQFGWLYTWNARDVKNRPRFFGGYSSLSKNLIYKQFPTPECYLGGTLKTIFSNDISGLQIYEVSGPVLARLERFLQIYTNTFGAI